jgi:hypothetical protein
METTNHIAAGDPAPFNEAGFTEGEHIVLRPVLEADLEELWPLLAEAPFEFKTEPWTLQRLKHKFEDKEEPGLWSKTDHLFTVARKCGGVVGFIRENTDHNPRLTWNVLHVGSAIPDREVLGRDALRAYRDYKLRWHHPLRISFSILDCEDDKAAWLEAEGYPLELPFQRSYFYRGEPRAEVLYTWFSGELAQLRADDGPVAGEEN